MRRSCWRAIAFVVVLTGLPGTAGAAGGLSLTLRTKTSYAQREPVELTATLKNESVYTLDITGNLEAFGSGPARYLEIKTPDGRRQVRELPVGSDPDFVDGITMEANHRKHFLGVLLAPNTEISTTYRPDRTPLVSESPRWWQRWMWWTRPGPGYSVTFSRRGTYEIRLVYRLPEDLEELADRAGGELVSNTVVIDVRKATRDEAEILDVYHDRYAEFATRSAYVHHERDVLAVIERYPDHPLTRHLVYQTALRWLPYPEPETSGFFAQSVAALEHLLADDPHFRVDEVSTLLARSYYNRGARREGLRVLGDALRADPALEHYFEYGWSVRLIESDVEIALQATQNEYVAREPVKFVVTFENTSGNVVNIRPPAQEELAPSRWIFEVTGPDGRVEYRVFENDARVCGYATPDISGQPLPPGAHLETFVYPNVTLVTSSPDSVAMRGSAGFTFGEPGTYTVRAGYYVPRRFLYIWSGPNGIVFSNPIELNVREPSTDERYMLDALWVGDRGDFNIEDDRHRLRVPLSESALVAATERYPDHPFARYLFFNLGRHYLTDASRGPEGYLRSVAIFEELVERYPQWRYEEVRLFLALAYYSSRQRDRAIAVFDTLIATRPAVTDNSRFMYWSMRIHADSERAFNEALVDWELGRQSVWFAAQNERDD